MGKLSAEYQREYAQREEVKARKKAWREENPEKELERKRRWREANAERHREYQRQWRERNREKVRAQKRAKYEARRAEILEYQRKRYEEHREELREYNRAYYQKNREALLAKAKAWSAANPDKLKSYSAVRRARELELPSEKIDYIVVFDRDEGNCGICGLPVEPDDWHLDHIVPLAKGGHHTYENVQVSHPACNLRKGVSVPS